MSLINVHSYLAGAWIPATDAGRTVASAVSGDPIAIAGGTTPDTEAIRTYALETGGPALRAFGFHDRARMLKALAQLLTTRKEELYTLSTLTGATRSDSWIDIDGGIGTLFAFASKGRRELPDGQTYLDGDVEMLSREGSFLGQHIAVPKRGVAVHINAFNFPVWGMLEKLAPTLLAGVPMVVKPATATSYVAEACARMMVESGILPDGALQLISGGVGDLLDHLGPQDVVSFTGSAATALALRSTPNILSNGVGFIAEQDSLNASVLGPDAVPGTPEFDLFVKEVATEITAKAGQKCTAIRRIMAPAALLDPLSDALHARLSTIRIGDPAMRETQMGALVSADQLNDVLASADRIGAEARTLLGGRDGVPDRGAFLRPHLYCCDDPDGADAVHRVEAFGPVATLMPYRDLDHACTLLARGGGSLVASVITHDPDVARTLALGSAAWHGRIYVNDRDSAAEATGHGSPLPHMIHGGPGRAGGGEEMGGIRGVMHYMQRTAIQGSPRMISAIADTWLPGAPVATTQSHPFERRFGDLHRGQTLTTEARTISLQDIEHFAHFTGDTFYAHMDEEAAAANPFFPGRVAHGYLLLSFAAGLFVHPDPGPVLANTGLNGLSFQKPVSPGDALRAQLTVKRKTRRVQDYGEVAWDVRLTNQNDEQVARYELLTMVAT
ncbi:MAG: phenylacetic acid degradation bifunctional protein PaaZ [Pseudomonadota bacterium]